MSKLTLQWPKTDSTMKMMRITPNDVQVTHTILTQEYVKYENTATRT